MKTSHSKKSAIKSASQEQHENLKNTRKTLKVLQQAADKENLVGRILPDTKLESKPDKPKLLNKAVQTGEGTVTADDLTSDEPSGDYWKLLAEKRQDALNDSLQENERLKEHVEALQEENRICKEMLEESKHLVEVLQEMIAEDGHNSTEVAEEATEDSQT